MSAPSLSEALEEALSQSPPAGRLELEGAGATAWVEVEALGPIGVRIKGLEVEVGDPAPADQQAHALAAPLPGLSGPLSPVEVDTALGGGLLRSPVKKDRYLELELRGGRGTLRPYTLQDRRRAPGKVSMSRESLGELLEELSEALCADGG